MRSRPQSSTRPLIFLRAPGGFNTMVCQMIAYFTTVFVAAPLAILTGLLMSPAVAARFKTAIGFLNRQMARTVHLDCRKLSATQYAGSQLPGLCPAGPSRLPDQSDRRTDADCLGRSNLTTPFKISGSCKFSPEFFPLIYVQIIRKKGNPYSDGSGIGGSAR